MTSQGIRIDRPEDLDRSAITRLARGGCGIELGDGLLAALAASRAAGLDALAAAGPVYGVTTGTGALSGVLLDADAQSGHQDTLMTARAVGSRPWLRRPEVRALLAVRLRTLLHAEAAVSPDLCRQLAALLSADVLPAVPARGGGAAGEIIPLAHAGAVLLGTGQVLDGRDAAVHDAMQEAAVDAAPALAAAGVPPRSFAAKEGIAFLQGAPGLTGLAIVHVEAVRRLLGPLSVALAAEFALAQADRDPLHPALGRGDAELGAVLDALRELCGDGPVRALQAPVSFRVSPGALAVTLRAVAQGEAAVDRALDGVSDSPAHLEGRFVGTAGFAGTDLVAALGALTTALVHLADLGAARLHRMLDDRVTGLPRQLSDAPGAHAGLVAVHKRAVGVAHRLRRFGAPALVGPVETSSGQEDVQSFGFEAAECVAEAVEGLRDVLACELLAIVQARRLASPDRVPASLRGLLDELDAALPAGTGDRPYGRDLDRIGELLVAGWAGQSHPGR
ncbi:aromatic amino acid lyase [Blastococcus sp. LR1]|uniref:aromatic amino acid lyase n=1 Tax=Blastococcus sp. LR1 TaxID=2877000 RepID=UPI001CCD4409|nr:aromatic amino acid lyase [Blastococcus sp. LR1]MCA0145306.1 aromatic amino acid ammonia-lyase [Blastococcus sp. LR1]